MALKKLRKTRDDKENLFTISELRKELGIPLILAKKLVLWGEIKASKALDNSLRFTKDELLKAKKALKKPRKKFSLYLRALGPGLITGASDDDPGGIGTYSSVGAQFGLSILWMAFWLLPCMLTIQEVCARIGIVTNRGLSRVLLAQYKKITVIIATTILLIANITNIGADIHAMSASLNMITKINKYVWSIIICVVIVMAEVLVPFRLYTKILKWLVISLFSYVITGFLIKPDWYNIFKFTFIPSFQFTREYFFAIVAVFGTTITPYLFFWQTSAEVEEDKRSHKKRDKKWMYGHIRKMRTDVSTGIVLANLVFYFIVITSAHIFHKHHIFDIETAEQAALILKPFAGNLAYFLFTAGILGTGMLAIPILAGSGAYALAGIMRWHEGFDRKFSRSRGFYFVIILSVFIGVLINFFNISPITALYYSAFLNGLIALPLMILIMIIGNNPHIMKGETHPRIVFLFGWITIGLMLIATSVTVVLFFIPHQV